MSTNTASGKRPKTCLDDYVYFDGSAYGNEARKCKGEGCKRMSQNKVGNVVTKTKWAYHTVSKRQGFSHEQKVKLAKKNSSSDTQQCLRLDSTRPN